MRVNNIKKNFLLIGIVFGVTGSQSNADDVIQEISKFDRLSDYGLACQMKREEFSDEQVVTRLLTREKIILIRNLIAEGCAQGNVTDTRRALQIAEKIDPELYDQIVRVFVSEWKEKKAYKGLVDVVYHASRAHRHFSLLNEDEYLAILGSVEFGLLARDGENGRYILPFLMSVVGVEKWKKPDVLRTLLQGYRGLMESRGNTGIVKLIDEILVSIK